MFSNIYDSFNFLIYAFWRCKNTKISENTQIFLVKILENTQIRRDGKQCKNTNPSLTGLTDWIEGQVIDVGHNPFMGLVISIKDNLGRIFFGQSKYFKIA